MANDKGGCSIMTDAQDRGRDTGAYAPEMTGEQVSAWAETLLANLRQPYPNKIAHEMSRDDDLAPPQVMTPVFCGCSTGTRRSTATGRWCVYVDAPTPRCGAGSTRRSRPASTT